MATQAPEVALRQAGAASLAEFPAQGQVPALVAGLWREEADDVQFRLAMALVRALRGTPDLHPEVAEVAQARLDGVSERCRVLMVTLLGISRAPGALDQLRMLARADRQALACAAVTALGRLGDPRGLDAVLAAADALDPERRLRAAEALGALGGQVALDRLVDMLLDEGEEPDVRLVVLRALQQADLSRDSRLRLTPRGFDDPLAVEVLQLRLGEEHAAVGAGDIDARLAAEGLRPERLATRHQGALRALRTAEFFYLPGAALPPGLDAAPPVIFWVKGLELWLGDLLRPLVREAAGAETKKRLASLSRRWRGLRDDVAPGWEFDLLGPGTAPFDRLCEDAARAMARHGAGRQTQSLRVLAALLLATRLEASELEWGPWQLGLDAGELVGLANRLVALSDRRNRVTHRVASGGEDNLPVREVALAVARLAGRLQVGG